MSLPNIYRVDLESHAFYKRVENLEKVPCTVCYCKFGNFSEGFIFAKLCIYMQSFMKMKSSQKGEITLSFTDIVKSSHSREFIASQICYLMLFAKILGFTVISSKTAFVCAFWLGPKWVVHSFVYYVDVHCLQW